MNRGGARASLADAWTLWSAPAGLGAVGAGDAVHAGDRLVGHQRHPGVVELQTRRDSWRLTATGDGGDRVDTELRHPHRVLLRRRTDHPGRHVGHPVATAVH